MSAFVVSDRVINGIVTFLASNPNMAQCLKTEAMRKSGFDITTPAGRSNVGDAMFRLNCIAVDERYGEGEHKTFREMNYRYKAETVSAIQAYASVRCWLYQCSEGDVPDTSKLYAYMDQVSDALAVVTAREYNPAMARDTERAHKFIRSLDAWSDTYWG